MIPSSRSMPSLDKRLPLDTWNTSELQGNVVGNQFSTFDPHRNPSQGIHYCATPRETGSVPQTTGTGTSFTRDEEQNRCTLPMPTLARRPSTMSSSIPVAVQQNSMQRQQISELQFDKFPTPSSFLCWEDKIQEPSDHLFWFSVESYVMDQRSGDGRFIGWTKILTIDGWQEFPNFKRLDAKIASALNKIIQNSHFKKKVSLEEQKAQKEDRFLRGRHIAFMINDCFRVNGAHGTVLDYADVFTLTLRNDDVQELYTRWDEVLLSVSKLPSDDILESLSKLRIRESVHLKTVLELYDMEIHQKISMTNYQKLKTMVKRSLDQILRLRNFDARHGRKLRQEQLSRIERD